MLHPSTDVQTNWLYYFPNNMTRVLWTPWQEFLLEMRKCHPLKLHHKQSTLCGNSSLKPHPSAAVIVPELTLFPVINTIPFLWLDEVRQLQWWASNKLQHTSVKHRRKQCVGKRTWEGYDILNMTDFPLQHDEHFHQSNAHHVFSFNDIAWYRKWLLFLQ